VGLLGFKRAEPPYRKRLAQALACKTAHAARPMLAPAFENSCKRRARRSPALDCCGRGL